MHKRAEKTIELKPKMQGSLKTFNFHKASKENTYNYEMIL